MKEYLMITDQLKLKELFLETRKQNAKPGGGAVVIIMANMAVNLSLMMDKKNWRELTEKANVSYETMVKISNELSSLADEDIQYINILLDEYKKGGSIAEESFIDCAKPQIRMNELCLDAMEILSFYLKHGKVSTLADGQIANQMMRAAILSSMPTIEINLRDTNFRYNKEEVIKRMNDLYNNNLDIIRERNI